MTILLNKDRNCMPAILAGLGLLSSIGGMAYGGPVGAVGDAYVISTADLGGATPSPVIKQYDGETGGLVGDFSSDITGRFSGMTWGPNGNLYASFLIQPFGFWQDREYDGLTGDFIQSVVADNSGSFSLIKGLTFGPDGDLYVGDWAQGTVTRYDGATFAVKATTPQNGIPTPNGMRFAPNGNLMVLSGGNFVREYDVSTGGINSLGTFATIANGQQPQDLTFGPNGNLFVSLGSVGGVEEFDGVTGTSLGQFIPLDSEMQNNGLAFDNFDRLLVAHYPVNKVFAYDAVTGAALGAFLTEEIGVAEFIPTIITIKPEAPSMSCNPADINGDGELDFIDISSFLEAYNSQTSAADLNGDMEYDFIDISIFIGSYSAGCP